MSLSKTYFKLYFIFRERGKKGEREGEKHRRVKETSIGCLQYEPQPGTKSTTQACALTRNQTSNFSLCRTTPSQSSHTRQGKMTPYKWINHEQSQPRDGLPQSHFLIFACCVVPFHIMLKLVCLTRIIQQNWLHVPPRSSHKIRRGIEAFCWQPRECAWALLTVSVQLSWAGSPSWQPDGSLRSQNTQLSCPWVADPQRPCTTILL